MEICTLIRSKSGLPSRRLIMLTAKSEEDDIITGLACGLDDYVTKPFSPRVLIGPYSRRSCAPSGKRSLAAGPARSRENGPTNPCRWTILIGGRALKAG